MGKLYKFVLTGGPCGGKTSALSAVREHLERKGFKVHIEEETATRLVNQGVFGSADHGYEFQLGVLKAQLKNRIGDYQPEEDTVYIYDRGMMDGKGFLPDKDDWLRMLDAADVTEEELLGYYDAVFFLVTAAKGAEEYYTLKNNTVRKESAEEARFLDDKLIDAWKAHPHYHQIENKGDFKQKLSDLINEIDKEL